MKNLFDKHTSDEIIKRIQKVNPGMQRQWGKMNSAQMLAHVNASLVTAMGHNVIPPVPVIGRLIGRLMKSGALSEKPFGKNSPTDKSYIFPADLNFEEQKEKAITSVKKFSEGGPSKVTTHPHPFFGHFTPEQWSIFQYKHLDHHLRQFGV